MCAREVNNSRSVLEKECGQEGRLKVVGPGVIIDVKSDTLFAVKLRKQVKIMHFDKLKLGSYHNDLRTLNIQME